MARASQNYYPDGEYLDKRNRVFLLKDEILQKLDSIPEVVDNLTSTSTTAALSANMGRRLNQRINSIEGGTRFLSLWDCAQGQPVSFPEHIPYAYETGDNYLVSNVSDGGTNFRPDGDAFSGQQSGVEETETVKPGDMYMYDGTNWLLQSNTPISVDSEGKFIFVPQSALKTQAVYDWTYDSQDHYALTIEDGNIIIWGPTQEQNGEIVSQSYTVSTPTVKYLSGTLWSTKVRYSYSVSSGTVSNDIAYKDNQITDTGIPVLTISGPGGQGSNRPHYTGQLWYEIWTGTLQSYNQQGTWDVLGPYFGGTNIIQEGTTWNAIDTKYVAGENITIGDGAPTTELDTKGPCPIGFHVPLSSEIQTIFFNTLVSLGVISGSWSGGLDDEFNFSSGNLDDVLTLFKVPKSGERYSSGSINYAQQGVTLNMYCSNVASWYDNHLRSVSTQLYEGKTIRPFKNTPVVPDNTWTILHDGTAVASGAGVFWNEDLGLISVSADGTTWYTVADKNLGASKVYNNGDALTQYNCGYYFQWGNNHGFPFRGQITNFGSNIDVTGYGPGNYYDSDKWGGYDISTNTNLWGGVSQGTHQELQHNVISAVVPNAAQRGNITGNLIDQTDLQSALDSKEDKVNKTNQIYAPGVMPDYEESGLLIFSPDGMHVSEVDGTTVKTYSLSTANDFAGQKILISTLTAPGNAFTGYLTDAGDRLILLGNTWRIAYGVYLDNGGTPFAFSDQATEVTYNDRINGTQPTYFKSTTNLYDYSDFENRNAEFVGMVLKENGGSEWGIRYIKYNDNNQCCKAEIGYYEWNNPSQGAYTWNIFDQLSNLDSISRIIYVGNGEYDGTCLVYGSYNGGSPKRYRTTSGWTNRYEPHDAYVDLNIQYNGTNILGTYHTNVKNIGNKNRFLSSDRYLGYKAIENGLLTKYNIVKDYLYRQEDNDNRVASQRSVESLSENKQDRINYTVENQANKIKDFTYAYNREKDFYNKEINGQQVAISGPHYVVYSDDGYHAGLICTDRNSGHHSYIGQIQTQRSFDYETDLPNMIEIDFNQFNFGNVNTRYVILGNDGLHLILRDRDCTHPLVVTTSVPWDFTPSNCTFEIQQPRDPNATQQGNVGYTADGLRIYTQDKNIYQTDTPFNFNQSHLTLIQNFTEIYSDRWTDQNVIKWSPDGKHFNLSGYRASPQSGYSRWSSYMYKTDTPYIINNIQLVVNYGYLDYDDMYLGTPTPIGCTRTYGPAYRRYPVTYFYIYADPEDIVSYPSMKALNEYVKANAGGQVDWNQTDITAKDYIKNKPTEIGNVSNNRGTVTSGNIAVFDGTTGKLIRDKGLSIVNTDTAPAGLGASQIYYDHGHIYIVSPSYQVQLENDDILLLENDDILLF